jgi:hypothetical protein
MMEGKLRDEIGLDVAMAAWHAYGSRKKDRPKGGEFLLSRWGVLVLFGAASVPLPARGRSGSERIGPTGASGSRASSA